VTAGHKGNPEVVKKQWFHRRLDRSSRRFFDVSPYATSGSLRF
jgi:hypothetical protein